jgi:hypothetical protein
LDCCILECEVRGTHSSEKLKAKSENLRKGNRRKCKLSILIYKGLYGAQEGILGKVAPATLRDEGGRMKLGEGKITRAKCDVVEK